MYGRLLPELCRICFGCSTSCRDVLWYCDPSGKYAGIIEDRSGRIEGKHAQMIPTFVSIADSIAAGGLSKVGSVEFEIAIRVCSRMIETRHTLEFVNRRTKIDGR